MISIGAANHSSKVQTTTLKWMPKLEIENKPSNNWNDSAYPLWLRAINHLKCLNQYQLNTNAFRRIRCIPRGAKDTAPTTQSGHRCCNVTKPRACRLTKIEPAGSPTFSGTKDTVSIEINVMLQNGTQNIWIAHANKRTSFSSLQHAGLKFFEFIIDNSY